MEPVQVISPWLVYAFTRYEAVFAGMWTLAFWLIPISIMIFVCTVLFMAMYADNEKKPFVECIKLYLPAKLLKISKSMLIIGLLFGFVQPFVPTKKELAAIIILPAIANSQTAQSFAINTAEGIVDLSAAFRQWAGELVTSDDAKSATKDIGKVVADAAKEAATRAVKDAKK